MKLIIVCPKIGTLLRLKGNFTHVTISIAYSIPIFSSTLIGVFFCTYKPFADSSQYLHSTYSVLPLKIKRILCVQCKVKLPII